MLHSALFASESYVRFLQHYIEFSHESSEAAAQAVCDRLMVAVLLQVFQQERFKLR